MGGPPRTNSCGAKLTALGHCLFVFTTLIEVKLHISVRFFHFILFLRLQLLLTISVIFSNVLLNVAYRQHCLPFLAFPFARYPFLDSSPHFLVPCTYFTSVFPACIGFVFIVRINVNNGEMYVDCRPI